MRDLAGRRAGPNTFGATAKSPARLSVLVQPDLEDIRLLRLAAMYEDAFERFVQEMARRHLDPKTQERLAPLAPERDQHGARIMQLLERLESNVPADQRPALARAALLDIVDVERAAREFYLGHIDRAHDPEVVQLFHDIAAEEGKHVLIAEQALDSIGGARRETSTRVPEPVDVPAWEGVTDFDRPRERPRRRSP